MQKDIVIKFYELLTKNHKINEHTESYKKSIIYKNINKFVNDLYDSTKPRVEPLNEKDTLMLRKIYGTLDGACKSQSSIAEETNTTRANINRKVNKIYKKVLESIQIIKYEDIEDKNLDLGTLTIYEIGLDTRICHCLKRIGIENLEELSSLSIKDLRKINQLGKSSYEKIIETVHGYGVKFKNEEYKNHLDDVLREKDQTIKKQELMDLMITEVDFPSITYHALKKHGIKTISDIVALKTEDFLRIPNIGQERCREIIDKIHKLGLYFTDENRKHEKSNLEIVLEEEDLEVKSQKALSLTVDELNFSTAIRYALKRKGINTVADLISFRTTYFSTLSNLGRQRCEEIVNKVHSFGLCFANETAIEKEKDSFIDILSEKDLEIRTQKALGLSIEEIKLDTLTSNVLKKFQIKTVADLVAMRTDYFSTMPCLGEKRCQRIIDKVHIFGLCFADEKKEIKNNSLTITKKDDQLESVISRKQQLLDKYRVLSKEKELLLSREAELDLEINTIISELSLLKNGDKSGQRQKTKKN